MGIFDAMEELKDDGNKDKVAAWMGKGYDIPANETREMLGDAHWTNYAENRQFFLNSNNPTNFERTYETAQYLYKKIKVIETEVPFDQLVDFSIVKKLDSASTALFMHCCSAKPIPEIVIELCRAMGEKTVFMKYTLKDSIVSSVSPSGATDGEDQIPLEQVSFRYAEIHLEYTPTDPTGGGKTGPAIMGAWSSKKNIPL